MGGLASKSGMTLREKKWEEEAAEREKDNDGNRSVIERVWAAGKGRTTDDKDR